MSVGLIKYFMREENKKTIPRATFEIFRWVSVRLMEFVLKNGLNCLEVKPIVLDELMMLLSESILNTFQIHQFWHV